MRQCLADNRGASYGLLSRRDCICCICVEAISVYSATSFQHDRFFLNRPRPNIHPTITGGFMTSHPLFKRLLFIACLTFGIAQSVSALEVAKVKVDETTSVANQE